MIESSSSFEMDGQRGRDLCNGSSKHDRKAGEVLESLRSFWFSSYSGRDEEKEKREVQGKAKGEVGSGVPPDQLFSPICPHLIGQFVSFSSLEHGTR